MLETINLHKTYPCGAQAVRGVSLKIGEGEALGLVGESGCGKSTLGKLIVRLEEAEKGQLFLEGQEYAHFPPNLMRPLRKKLQIIFQDSAGSLNPLKTIFQSLAEPLDNFERLSNGDKKFRIEALLTMVGLEPDHATRYPHQLSGGQRQRVVIARALALKPRWVVCDEPVSSLDVIVQHNILKLLKDLKKEQGLAYLFISHDLAAVNYLCDRVAIMYAGEIIEILPIKELPRPRHPYTQALLASVPTLGGRFKRRVSHGEPPNPARLPSGCAYHPRCFQATAICCATSPPLKVEGDRAVACHLPLEA